MKLRLGEIEEKPGRVTLKGEPEDLELEWKDGCFRSPVCLELKVFRRGDRFLAQGEITTSVDARCSRCLREFPLPVRTQFKLTIELTPKGNNGDNVEEDYILLSPQSEVLDLRERVRQLILLSLPVKPLCHPNCRGLCPICGKDLNEGECGCRREEYDPRWEKLKSLR